MRLYCAMDKGNVGGADVDSSCCYNPIGISILCHFCDFISVKDGSTFVGYDSSYRKCVWGFL